MHLNSYPKVWALGNRNIKDIYQGTFHIEEKIDGSQFSFGLRNGEVCIRSKGAKILLDNPPKMFQQGVGTVLALKDKLKEGWTYRSEYLSKPKHNCLTYERIPYKHIILYDVEDPDGNPVEYGVKQQIALELGLEVVPLILGRVNFNPDSLVNQFSLELFTELLKKESILGGTTIEGFVVKNYGRCTLEEGKYMCGKYVSEAFKEKNQKGDIKTVKAVEDIIDILGNQLRTEARWEKAVQHLRDSGNLEDDPKDIGKLLKELHQDTLVEESDYIKEQLFQWAWKSVMRKVQYGFAEWYKKKLLERSLEDTNEEV